MVNHTVSMLLWGAIALVLFQVVSTVAGNIQHKRKARQLGCEDPPRVPAPVWDVIGIQRIRRNLAAAKAFRFPEFLLTQHETAEKIAGFDAMTYNFNLFGRTTYFTSDPKNLQAMLATKFKDFSLPPTRKGTFYQLLGNGIFTSDGKAWEHSRAMLRPNFAREQVSNLELEERHNQNLLRAIPMKGDADGWTAPVDMCKLFFRLTIDSSTEFLFGESVDSQLGEMSDGPAIQNVNNPLKREMNFSAAFDNAQTFIARRGRLGRRWWLLRSKEYDEDCKKCHQFIDHYVRLALQQDTKPSDAESKDGYVFLNELATQTRDPIELRSQLLHILLAGRDTTAGLLSWLVLLLSRHPDIFAKLRRAILEDFGTTSDTITFAKLKSNTYLQACLNETLRLFPVVPANSRHAVVDTTLPRGGGPKGEDPIFIPAGTDVTYSVYVMHRQKSIWGEDADEFKPERFIKRKQGFEFLPFNGGPRVCLGQNFALTSAGYATVKLLQRFDGVRKVEGEESSAERPRQMVTLTTRPAGGSVVQWHVPT